MHKIFSITKDSTRTLIYILGIKISIGKPHIHNYIYVINSKTGVKRRVRHINGIKIEFRKSDSSVTIYEPFISFKNNEFILTENCHIVIGNKTNSKLYGMQNIKISMVSNNAKLTIGTDFYNAYSTYNIGNNANVEIGNDCMFSGGIHILAGDCHNIIDKKSGTILSKNSNLRIGNHVWVGSHSTILKNASIQSDSIVGANSLVASKFDESNIIIAGNPAKIIKKDIDWEK